MTSGLGSISLTASTLLGGTAGKIDTDALVAALMAAKSVPKNQLQAQVTQQGQILTAYQSINTTMAGITTAAQNLLDTSSWSATKVTSSSTAVVASSTSAAAPGSTTFNVTQLATAQVSTVAADASGNWTADYTQGIDIAIGQDAAGNPVTHHLSLASGSVTDIAAAINNAGIGVRAAVVTVDDPANAGKTMPVLQLSSAKSGAANSFSVSGLASSANTISAAQDAKISVGNPAAGGYTISSSSNTFTNALPGITFSVNGVADNVTLTVDSDTTTVAGTVQAMVSAVNSAKLAIGNYTDKGGVLQGNSDINGMTQDLSSVFSSATAGGRSLTDFGIDINKDGIVTFNADTFAAAYANDPTGTMQAIADSVATPLKTISDAASAPVTGSISQAITSANDRTTSLNQQISDWTDRLNTIQTQLQTKFIAMQTALARLQSQGDWLTNMFKSMQPSSSSNGQ
ncbi:MAG: hypothetical protein BGO26_16170 [Actinobacteria bacterium 69-20]|nr:flagellar filament capping protein FliD [Actinomycetota bacterium]OJV27828.1 MAG: hypothetical protein BGO26_16170 [Actinobacteria bacterium 69-20]